jgi:hypothetical protein
MQILNIPQNSNDHKILGIRCTSIESLLDQMGIDGKKTGYEVQYYVIGQHDKAPCIEIAIYETNEQNLVSGNYEDYVPS